MIEDSYFASGVLEVLFLGLAASAPLHQVLSILPFLPQTATYEPTFIIRMDLIYYYYFFFTNLPDSG